MPEMLSIKTISPIAVVFCFDHAPGWLVTSSVGKVLCLLRHASAVVTVRTDTQLS